jgi:hypothetical protein
VPVFLWCQDASGVSISDTRTILVPEKGPSSSPLDPIVRERLIPEARWHQNDADTRRSEFRSFATQRAAFFDQPMDASALLILEAITRT